MQAASWAALWYDPETSELGIEPVLSNEGHSEAYRVHPVNGGGVEVQVSGMLRSHGVPIPAKACRCTARRLYDTSYEGGGIPLVKVGWI